MQINKVKKHTVGSLSKKTVPDKDLSKVKNFSTSGLSIGPVSKTTNSDVKYQQPMTTFVNSSVDQKLVTRRSIKVTKTSQIPIEDKTLQLRHIKGGGLSQVDKGTVRDNKEGVSSIQLPISTGSRLAAVPNNDEHLQLSQVEAGEFVTMPLINHDAVCPTTTTSEISNSEVTSLLSLLLDHRWFCSVLYRTKKQGRIKVLVCPRFLFLYLNNLFRLHCLYFCYVCPFVLILTFVSPSFLLGLRHFA